MKKGNKIKIRNIITTINLKKCNICNKKIKTTERFFTINNIVFDDKNVKSQNSLIFCVKCYEKNKKVEKILNNLKHTGWISKDILYDNCKTDEECCVCDIEEIKRILLKQNEK